LLSDLCFPRSPGAAEAATPAQPPSSGAEANRAGLLEGVEEIPQLPPPAQSTSSASSSRDGLLPEWEQAVDGRGRVYFYHRVSRESRWEKPILALSPDVQPAQSGVEATRARLPPDEPYLAWVPADDGSGKHWLRCLLCEKWVEDEVSHSGSEEAPAGSQEHQKRLRWWSWYAAGVAEERLKYHPATHEAPLVSSSRLAATLPPGWAMATDEMGREFYVNHAQLVMQHHHPRTGELVDC